MIRIAQIRLPCGHARDALEEKIQKTLRLDAKTISWKIVLHSVDARKKPLLYDTYTVDVETGLSAKKEAALVRRARNRNVAMAPADPWRFPKAGNRPLGHRPVIVGAGPAGLFCALLLAEHGYRPLLIERGRRMEERSADVGRFWAGGNGADPSGAGILPDPNSNVQFGEGGAGTFSDGKLNTQVNDRTGRAARVLQAFVDAGAPDSILYEGKPHIGTDRLRVAIPNLRRRIEAAGGEVRFCTVCEGLAYEGEECAGAQTPCRGEGPGRGPGDIDAAPNRGEGPGRGPGDIDAAPNAGGGMQDPGAGHRRIRGVYVRVLEGGQTAGGAGTDAGPGTAVSGKDPEGPSAGEFIPADVVVLAIGHSARDTIEALWRQGVPMEQKKFAVGLRVAHPQALIDESQYGTADPAALAAMRLSAAPYKLTARAASGRGVYSFCMCPGGYVVNASSEAGRLCVNGMSDRARDSGWANSAIVVTVGGEEFGGRDALAGLRFQRDLEEKAFALGRGAIPIQGYVDFREAYRREHTDRPAEKDSSLPPGREGAGEGKGPALCGHPLSRPSSPGDFGASACSRDHLAAFAARGAKGACRPAPVHMLLPPSLAQDFIEGMDQFGEKIRGFDGPRAVVAGIESRTSSPVRIPRGEDLESPAVAGFYPCGEGAGYAGGIMSAAMDGMRVAEAIARKYGTPLSVQD